MRRRLLLVATLTLVLAIVVSGAAAQGPTPTEPIIEIPEPPQAQIELEPMAEIQGVAQGAAFLYQGRLTKGGQPVSATCDFQFSLFDAAAAGRQVGEQLPVPGLPVSAGVFNARLDFGGASFTGEGRWLQVAVKCPGDEGFVLFSTRQELAPAPYAISLVPGATVRATSTYALLGQSDTEAGLAGESRTNAGVRGISREFDGVWGRTLKPGLAGVSGRNTTAEGGFGVWGYNKGPNGHAIFGVSDQGTGVTGVARADNRSAVFGSNEAGGAGVFGLSARGDGVFGVTRANNKSAVFGSNEAGGAGVFGRSDRGDGVFGVAQVDNRSGVVGINNAGGPGVYGYSARGYAGDFNGKVRVKVLEITGGADLAEPFAVRAAAGVAPEAGMVVCIDPTNPGALVVCAAAADRTVAGVISGAGGVQPGLVMRQSGTLADGAHPIALTGRVYVWVDASERPVAPGDLLTTSALPGYAQAAGDDAQGALIGKAMTGLAHGSGLVMVLVSLQ